MLLILLKEILLQNEIFLDIWIYNRAAFEKEIEGMPSTRSVGDLPPELHCPLCREVMKDAVLTSKCCFKSFCDKCKIFCYHVFSVFNTVGCNHEVVSLLYEFMFSCFCYTVVRFCIAQSFCTFFGPLFLSMMLCKLFNMVSPLLYLGICGLKSSGTS